MTGILNTATSGLLAYQHALDTIGHNIANADTEGYSRQRVELSARRPHLGGVGYIGNGVQVDSVRRLYDQFVTGRLRTTAATSAQYQTYSQFAGRVADVLGDPQAGLGGGLQSFFQAVQGVANDPGSVPARQLMLTEGESLASRFQFLDRQTRDLRQEVGRQLDDLTGQITDLSQSIAALNKDIVVARGKGAGQPPNDLLDKRDQLLQKLSRLVRVRTVPQDDGIVNVFIGNGQALVTGFQSARLETVGNEFDATRKDVVYRVGGSSTLVTDNLVGGQLGGLLAFRKEILDPAQNALGRMAAVLGVRFNQQHRLGQDLNGNPGGDFFSLDGPVVAASSRNSGAGTVTASFDPTDISNLTTQDYVLSFDGTNWSMRTTSGQAVGLTGAGTTASPFKVDGLSIVVGGTPAAGDRFLIQPTRHLARGLGLAVQDVNAIAAAAPVSLGEVTGSGGTASNGGDGAFRLQSLAPGFTPPAAAITFTYDSTNKRFSYSDGGSVSGTLAYDPAQDAGKSFTVAGATFSITGNPANGDRFVLAATTGNAGDNHNARALADLQTALTLDGGTTSLQGGYAQLISDIGSRTRQARINGEAQQAMFQRAQKDRDAIAGVNLDEEAANLLRFQKAYQAMAQVVSVADSMFQTLLSAVRR